MTEQPGYYAILTADVRYDKTLSPMAKLLFAEITALTQKEGFAWASNGYFAKLYDVHPVTVSGWVKELVNAKYISIYIDRKAGNLRKITINQNTKGLSEKTKSYKRKDLDPISEKANIILQENNKKNKAALALESPAAKNQDHRGIESPAKERIRQAIKSGNLRSLKNA